MVPSPAWELEVKFTANGAQPFVGVTLKSTVGFLYTVTVIVFTDVTAPSFAVSVTV